MIDNLYRLSQKLDRIRALAEVTNMATAKHDAEDERGHSIHMVTAHLSDLLGDLATDLDCVMIKEDRP